jgi:hypothetical protein
MESVRLAISLAGFANVTEARVGPVRSVTQGVACIRITTLAENYRIPKGEWRVPSEHPQ